LHRSKLVAIEQGLKDALKRRVTIHDVAIRAGVSKVTVSYVLNGRGPEVGIKAETAQRILDAARDLNYQPNAIARMLSRRSSETVAILFHSGTSFSRSKGFNGEVLDGVSEACVGEGFDVMLHTKLVRDAQAEASSLMDGRVDGLLVLRDVGDPTFEILKSRGFPMVQFFTHSEDPEMPSVDCDNQLGGELAARHLIELGHRRIAMATGSPRSVSATERLIGFKRAVEQASLETDPEWLIPEVSLDHYVSCLLKLLKKKDAPTAIFVWYDSLAVRIMDQLREQSIRVPEDLSIIGFDSLALAETASPALTSVYQPVRQMAVEATRMLASIIRDSPPEKPQLLFPPRLDIRSSTAKPTR
jgi:DNA-binding LacI/PurR family transcriptional regulator